MTDETASLAAPGVSGLCDHIVRQSMQGWLGEAVLLWASDPQALRSVDGPFSLLRGAVHEPECLRALARWAAMLGATSAADGVYEALIEGSVFARLVAIQSRERGDKSLAIALLAMASRAGKGDAAKQYAAEAIAWVETLAEAGDEDAAALIATYIAGESTEIVEIAKEMQPPIAALWSPAPREM